MTEFPVQSFRLSGKGLSRVLGDLEQQILESVWAHGPSSIREVWQTLSTGREISFNAVMTVMNRLTEKALLEREGAKGHYKYSAVYTRGQFMEQVSENVAKSLVQDFGELAVPHFVKALQSADPALIAELRNALKDDKSSQ